MVLKLKNGYLKMSDPDLQRKANHILFSMKDNVNFPHPIPTIVTMENCLKTYIRLLAESSTGDRICIAQKNAARIPLIHNLHQWGYYVLWMSNGDPVKAMSSGFTLGYIPGPRTALEKPTALSVTKGINDGDLVCRGNWVAGAISYLFEYASEQNPDDWKSVPSTRVKYVFKGLKIRTLYYFRIAAVGANNQIAYSDIIDRTAT